MGNLLANEDMPIGLGMALAENTDAMRQYANMSDPQRQDVLRRARDVRSREEMHELVRSLV